jgi:rhomboid family GlyGly-CTERM serine protease
VHINWPHALINAAAWWVVARLFAPELPPARQVAVLLTAALVIGLGLALAYPGIAWYRGFSGVLHALFFAGTVAWLAATLRRLRAARNADRPLAPRALLQALWLPAVLLVGGAVKVIAEQPAGSTTPYADWLGSGTVPQAHLLGGLVGALFGALWGLRSPAPMQGRPT